GSVVATPQSRQRSSQTSSLLHDVGLYSITSALHHRSQQNRAEHVALIAPNIMSDDPSHYGTTFV
ncbi:hypothetical protein MHZ93_24525, partial [Roseomonas sp. ACRSG]|nr:hypothetical protein [Roseomonas sp. ACRSG]